MKRASLTIPPPSSKIEPADLTDRLLEREAGVSASTARSEKKRREAPPSRSAQGGGAPVEKAAAAQTHSAPTRATATTPDPRSGAASTKSRDSGQTRPGEAKSHAPAVTASAQQVAGGAASVAVALEAAAAARDALHRAARLTPARFNVALRYRLDALAHHIQQVADFVNALAKK